MARFGDDVTPKIIGRDKETEEELVDKIEEEDGHRGDGVAELVRSAFQIARRFRQMLSITGGTVDAVLLKCRQQYYAVPDAEETAKMRDVQIYQKTSLTRYKHNIALAWARELMQGGRTSFLKVSPTPEPTLSEEDEIEVFQNFIKSLSQGQGDGTIDGLDATPANRAQLIKEHRDAYIAEQNKIAQAKADAMQTHLDDFTAQSKFAREFDSFLAHFFLYPYAVMIAPLTEYATELEWKNGKPSLEARERMACRHVHPMDYFWSPDTPTAGEGEFDIVRDIMTRHELAACKGREGWIDDSIDKVLDKWDSYAELREEDPFFPRRESIDDPIGATLPDHDIDFAKNDIEKPAIETLEGEPTGGGLGASNPSHVVGERPFDLTGTCSPRGKGIDGTVKIMRYWGICSGAELNDFIFTKQQDEYDRNEFYEIEAVVCGDVTLSLIVEDTLQKIRRPIYSASYVRQPTSVAGMGLAQIIEPLESLFMGILRYTVRNAALSADPPSEVNIDQLALTDESGEYPARIDPGTVLPRRSEYGTDNKPIFASYPIANNTASLANFMNYWKSEIDNQTGIPAAMSGQPIGTGVNRTFRGIVQLRNNAAMVLQSAFNNIDKQILGPLGIALYNYAMITSDDPSIKGDCRIESTGLGGLLDAELAKQEAIENMSVFIPLIAANQAPPKLGGLLTEAAITGKEIDVNAVRALYAEWNPPMGQQPPQQEGAQQATGAPNGQPIGQAGEVVQQGTAQPQTGG